MWKDKPLFFKPQFSNKWKSSSLKIVLFLQFNTGGHVQLRVYISICPSLYEGLTCYAKSLERRSSSLEAPGGSEGRILRWVNPVSAPWTAHFGVQSLDLHANPNYRNLDKKSFWCLLRCNSPFARRLTSHQWETKSIIRQRLHMAKCVLRIENHLERRQHSFHVTKKSCFRQAMDCDRCNISFSSSRYHSMAHE